MGYIEKSLIAGILFALTIGSGVWFGMCASKSNVKALSNAHRLLALLAVVSSVVFALPLLKTATGVTLALCVGAALLFVVLFVSGASMRPASPLYARMRSAHVTGTILLLVIGAAAVLLWLRK